MWRSEIRRDSITRRHVCHLVQDKDILCVLLCVTLCLCGFSVVREAQTATRSVNVNGKEKGARRAPLVYMAGPTRLELATSGVTGLRSNQLNYDPANQGEWWEVGDLNPRPPACKAGALTPELTSQTADRWERNGRCLSVVCQPSAVLSTGSAPSATARVAHCLPALQRTAGCNTLGP